jgi:hypothetical protein
VGGGPYLAPATGRVNAMGSGPGTEPPSGRAESNSHHSEGLGNGEWSGTWTGQGVVRIGLSPQ